MRAGRNWFRLEYQTRVVEWTLALSFPFQSPLASCAVRSFLLPRLFVVLEFNVSSVASRTRCATLSDDQPYSFRTAKLIFPRLTARRRRRTTKEVSADQPEIPSLRALSI